MPKSKPQESFLSKNNITLILLIFFAFAAGFLWNKVQTLEKGSTTKPQQAAPVTTTAGPRKTLNDLAQATGLDKSKIKKCIESGKFRDKVTEQQKEGITAGVNATPTSVVYDIETGKTIIIEGAVPYEDAKDIIDKFIKGESPSSEADSYKIKKPNPKEDHWRGDLKARFIMVEYSDFECPFCQKFHPTATQLLSAYKDKLAWVYRHFPIESIHPMARKLAEAAECAFELKGEDGFWKLTDEIFRQMPNVSIN